MKSQQNVDAWFAALPAEVAQEAGELLAQVQAMRDVEIIYPPQDDILNALAYTAPADVRAVILGQDPYHGPNQAMGLSFSVPEGEKLPPSLRNIYKEMAADLGCAVPQSGDLTAWADAGVLLLNTTLTVREHAAASHAKLGWQLLTSHVVRQCFEQSQPIVFFAWGRHAQKLIQDAAQAAGATEVGCDGASVAVDASELPAVCDAAAGLQAYSGDKFVLASTHPSPLSASRPAGGMPAFLGSRPFSRANALLKAAGAEPIDWACIACGQETLF